MLFGFCVLGSGVWGFKFLVGEVSGSHTKGLGVVGSQPFCVGRRSLFFKLAFKFSDLVLPEFGF